jgi:hypothetical protein
MCGHTQLNTINETVARQLPQQRWVMLYRAPRRDVMLNSGDVHSDTSHLLTVAIGKLDALLETPPR